VSPILAERPTTENGESTSVFDFSSEDVPHIWYRFHEEGPATEAEANIPEPVGHLWRVWSALQRGLFPETVRYRALSKTADQGSAVEHALLELVRNDIHIERVRLVRNYLLLHSEMAEELTSLALEARTAFPTRVQIVVSLHQDRETSDSELVVFVRAPDYSSEIFETIESVRNQHGAEFAASSASLFLTTDFERPRTLGL
jgi:hypothetical protein